MGASLRTTIATPCEIASSDLRHAYYFSASTIWKVLGDYGHTLGTDRGSQIASPPRGCKLSGIGAAASGLSTPPNQ